MLTRIVRLTLALGALVACTSTPAARVAPGTAAASACFRADGALWPPLAAGDSARPNETFWLVLTDRALTTSTGAAELRHATRRRFTGHWTRQAHDTLLIALSDGFSQSQLWLREGPDGVTGHGQATTDDVEAAAVEWLAAAQRVSCEALSHGRTPS